MLELARVAVDDALRVEVVATERTDGDMHPLRVDRDALDRRHRAVWRRRVPLLDQRHGTDVVDVGSRPGWPVAGIGDVMVAPATHRSGVALWAADCAPVILVGSDGTLAAAHAGWRGLAAGVIDVAVRALTADGTRIVGTVIGPLIHPCCYEFGRDDLVAVADGVHARPDSIEAAASSGGPALDVPAALAAALLHHGVTVDVMGPCTGCDLRWFSHRVRAEPERHVVSAHLVGAVGGGGSVGEGRR